MRDPIKILQHRASKVPAIQNFLDTIQDHAFDDIDSLDIKPSDKKLLRTHYERLREYDRQATLNAALLKATADMQEDPEELLYDVFVYEGMDTTYDGMEVPPGTIVTQHDDWIRFDYYRIKIKQDTTPILSQCRLLDSMNINDTNKLIFNMINHRHGGSTDSGDRYLAGGFQITRH